MKNVLIVGGDFRQIIVAGEMKKSGYNVKIFGFDEEYTEGLPVSENLFESVSESDIIIMGLPALKDGKFINAPLWSGIRNFFDIVSFINKDTVVMGGMLSENFINEVSEKTGRVYDYYNREALIVKNVVPTA